MKNFVPGPKNILHLENPHQLVVTVGFEFCSCVCQEAPPTGGNSGFWPTLWTTSWTGPTFTSNSTLWPLDTGLGLEFDVKFETTLVKNASEVFKRLICADKSCVFVLVEPDLLRVSGRFSKSIWTCNVEGDLILVLFFFDGG